ncbi:enoyl-CoA hydratase/isomerase family protein [Streptomyces sp. DH10]|uniref:enoyl-CoA hydratase/isomerase family protein n=1 Tax=Streptomyces sp. DH10 TaxID=3040121 RepID=UPI003FA6AA80
MHDDARDGDGTASAVFGRDAYRLNARIARYPKPYVAVVYGIVMGEGAGVPVSRRTQRPCRHRAVPGVAMSETGIGFVPGGGGTHLLAAASGGLGTHLALTGAQIGAPDTLLCGLADHYVPTASLRDLLDVLADLPVGEALAGYVRMSPEASWPPSATGPTPAAPPTPSRRSSAGCSRAAAPARRRPGPCSPRPRPP